ncbi:MAG TPA: hypothetical protein VFC72_02950, partial [Corynebacterium sp.]|nr:hypothetical protein [Corynebacterium sp.]
MTGLQRYAPILSILGLLLLVGFGGGAVASTTQSPLIDPAGATIQLAPPAESSARTAPGPTEGVTESDTIGEKTAAESAPEGT